jgi:hypothetical protein
MRDFDYPIIDVIIATFLLVEVLQHELSDFFVQYYLLTHLEDANRRHEVLSTLHGQIQDAFNEFGAQIMSPHFEGQPEKKVYVPKPQWYSAPASPPFRSEEANRKIGKELNSPL